MILKQINGIATRLRNTSWSSLRMIIALLLLALLSPVLALDCVKEANGTVLGSELCLSQAKAGQWCYSSNIGGAIFKGCMDEYTNLNDGNDGNVNCIDIGNGNCKKTGKFGELCCCDKDYCNFGTVSKLALSSFTFGLAWAML
ncbi:hypothetical protein L596_009906 [Steinernema carpocapsae]|uniref:Activin types I and II receptor domain-containing protein n=1 Tax=Steinernema carpocapsae TaxID=34508 RepID=A0A4U5PGQ2_STECR|nr:hypothetical protein L596_009906 [Steinernema carpocapsae]